MLPDLLFTCDCDTLTMLYISSLLKVLLSGEPPSIDHDREYPSGDTSVFHYQASWKQLVFELPHFVGVYVPSVICYEFS